MPLCFARLSTISSIRQYTRTRIICRYSSQTTGSASEKLFADAEIEEIEEQRTPALKQWQIRAQENQGENWTGDESVHDAVLRMLVDKHKPLRTGVVRTAEEKTKASPTCSAQSDWSITAPPSGNWANQPILPSIANHRPWHTVYKAPSHAVSVRAGHIPPPASSRAAITLPVDERARWEAKARLKRSEQAGRITQARESTLDYKLGVKREPEPEMKKPKQARPNPVSLKGWTTLIEDKIERARQAGLFRNVQGRGQAIVRKSEESNPFISQEEFLMNRIIQRNGAAPPWVEVQGELETAAKSFRDVLRQSWTRRAIRNITNEGTLSAFDLSPEDASAIRDVAWETRERSYHDVAVKELNDLVRKYNAVAPYAVRRPYYMRSVEVEKAYADAGPEIVRGMKDRLEKATTRTESGDMEDGNAIPALRIRDVVFAWIERWKRIFVRN